MPNEDLRTLLASWSRLIGDINTTRGPTIAALPEPPQAEEIAQLSTGVLEILQTSRNIVDALVKEGVMRRVEPIWDAIDAEEEVPEEIRRLAESFSSALTSLTFQLMPAAYNWLTRADEKFELEHLEQQASNWREELRPRRNLAGLTPPRF